MLGGLDLGGDDGLLAAGVCHLEVELVDGLLGVDGPHEDDVGLAHRLAAVHVGDADEALIDAC